MMTPPSSSNSNPWASVIIPIKEYEEMIERLEDAKDVAYLKQARTKPLSFRPLKDYLAERRKARV